MNDSDYFNKLLESWEETYKKGQLSFWIMLSLKNSPLYIKDIKSKIYDLTEGSIVCEEQSLYRALRKFFELEIVDYVEKEGRSGPNRKYYFLTELGNKLLNKFIDKNINVFFTKKVKKLLEH